HIERVAYVAHPDGIWPRLTACRGEVGVDHHVLEAQELVAAEVEIGERDLIRAAVPIDDRIDAVGREPKVVVYRRGFGEGFRPPILLRVCRGEALARGVIDTTEVAAGVGLFERQAGGAFDRLDAVPLGIRVVLTGRAEVNVVAFLKLGVPRRADAGYGRAAVVHGHGAGLVARCNEHHGVGDFAVDVEV